MLEAIFSSKLYKASSRKDSIDSAINDPINIELVKQLREYLDDEYLTEDYVDVQDAPDDKDDGDQKIRPSEHSDNQGGRTPLSEKHEDLFKDDDGKSSESSESGETKEANESSKEPKEDSNSVSESSKVSGESIVSSRVPESAFQSISDLVDSIKGILNAREDTAGVSRVLTKTNEKELWIYYNDKVNLNNVMETVISV